MEISFLMAQRDHQCLQCVLRDEGCVGIPDRAEGAPSFGSQLGSSVITHIPCSPFLISKEWERGWQQPGMLKG